MPDPELRLSTEPIDYQRAVAQMEARAEAIAQGRARELVWLLEHPALVTAGTSADPAELLEPDRFPVHRSGRGGRFTYHGPGQRIGYLLLDLAARGRDVRRFVHGLEGWLIDALGELGVAARRAPGRIGIWVDDAAGQEAKIGAIGVRVRRWVTLHGFSLNVSPDLSHFDAIVPCGIADHPVTSLRALGRATAPAELDAALLRRLPAFLDALAAEPNAP